MVKKTSIADAWRICENTVNLKTWGIKMQNMNEKGQQTTPPSEQPLSPLSVEGSISNLPNTPTSPSPPSTSLFNTDVNYLPNSPSTPNIQEQESSPPIQFYNPGANYFPRSSHIPPNSNSNTLGSIPPAFLSQQSNPFNPNPGNPFYRPAPQNIPSQPQTVNWMPNLPQNPLQRMHQNLNQSPAVSSSPLPQQQQIGNRPIQQSRELNINAPPPKKVATPAKNSNPPSKQSELPAENRAAKEKVDKKAEAYQLVAKYLKSLPDYDKKFRFIIRTGTFGKDYPKWEFLVLVYDETKDLYSLEKRLKFGKNLPTSVMEEPMTQRMLGDYSRENSYWTAPRKHKGTTRQLSAVMGLNNFEFKENKLWINPAALANLANTSDGCLLKIGKKETTEKRKKVFFESFEMYSWGITSLPENFFPPDWDLNKETFFENKKSQSPLTKAMASQNVAPSSSASTAPLTQTTSTSQVIPNPEEEDDFLMDIPSVASKATASTNITSTSPTTSTSITQTSPSEPSATFAAVAQTSPSEKEVGDQPRVEQEEEDTAPLVADELQRNNRSKLVQRIDDLQQETQRLKEQLNQLDKSQKDNAEEAKKQMETFGSSQAEVLKKLTEYQNRNENRAEDWEARLKKLEDKPQIQPIQQQTAVTNVEGVRSAQVANINPNRTSSPGSNSNSLLATNSKKRKRVFEGDVSNSDNYGSRFEADGQRKSKRLENKK